MTTKPHTGNPVSFLERLLAPLPKGEEQVDTPKFRKVLEDDAEREFAAAFHIALGAKAACDLTHEQSMVAMYRGESGEHDRLRAVYQVLFKQMQAVISAVAAMPAPNRFGVERKKRLLGVWLTAEGGVYDHYRASVAADEARFPKKRRAA